MTDTHDHDHDRGLRADLPRLLGRRAVLSGALAAVAGPAAAQAMSCVGFSTETAGPFPADGSQGRASFDVLSEAGALREDLRPSFAGMTPVADGVPLTLELALVSAGDCTPLPGRALYLWHCDAAGRYSLYEEEQANYLRGVGVSGDDGIVRFTTVFPGCYAGRWPHFHLEVFDSADAIAGGDSRLTSQISLPYADCADVYEAHPAYVNGTRNLSRQSFERDMIFADNTPEQIEAQMLKLSGSPTQGYRGTIVIGLT